MFPKETDAEWQQMYGKISMEMNLWREKHRKATFNEIENELDMQLSGLRTRMLEDIALAHANDDWTAQGAQEQPICPNCQSVLKPRGKHTRHLQTSMGKQVKLKREYGECPHCKSGFFPPR